MTPHNQQTLSICRVPAPSLPRSFWKVLRPSHRGKLAPGTSRSFFLLICLRVTYHPREREEQEKGRGGLPGVSTCLFYVKLSCKKFRSLGPQSHTDTRAHTRTPTVGAVIVSGERGGSPSQLSAVVLACQGSVPPCGMALREVGGQGSGEVGRHWPKIWSEESYSSAGISFLHKSAPKARLTGRPERSEQHSPMPRPAVPAQSLLHKWPKERMFLAPV